MRTTLLLVALLAVGLVALPAAQAQRQMPVLTIQSDQSAVLLDAQAVNVVHFRAQFHADLTTMATYPNGVPVSYTILEAPAWAVVTISPTSDVIRFGPDGLSTTGMVDFRVSILAPEAAHREIGALKIGAKTEESAFQTSAMAVESISLRVGEDGACHDESNSQAEAATGADADGIDAPAALPAAAPDDALRVQTGAATLLRGGWPIVLGFATAGGLAGYVLRRRRP